MWIKKIENTKGIRYKYYERFKDPISKKLIKISVTLNSNNQHAKKVAAEMMRANFEKKTKTASEKKAEKLEGFTFHMLADEWNEYTKPMVKPETVKSHQNYINRINKAIPPEMLFSDFTPAMAERIACNMYYTEKLSFSYSKSTLIIIKSMMRYAKKSGYIDNIAEFEEIRLKKRPATEKELQTAANKFLDKDELKECLNQLKKINPRISLAMEFIALTGLRCGEMLALRIKDYDKQNSLINVNGTILKSAANGDDIQRGTPKNVYSYRDVQLNKRAKDILDWFIVDNKRLLLWNKGSYHDKGYIFTTYRGNPYNIQFINKKLREIQIPGKKISTHLFRHTHISLLAEMGVPLKAIMQRVGHNDPNTTLGIYTHVTNNMKEELIKKLEVLSV